MRRKPELQSNYVPVPLAGGLNAQIDTHLVTPPTCLQATNLRYSTAGAVRRRHGTQSVAAPTGGTGPYYLGATNLELLAQDSLGAVSAFNPSASAWSARGQGAAFQLKTQVSVQIPVPQANAFAQLRDVSSARINNIAIAVWDTGATASQPNAGRVFVTCYDANNGTNYWQTSVTGVTVSNNWRMYGASSNSTLSNITLIGASSPVVQAYKNNFIIAYLVGYLATDSYTGMTGTCFGLVCFSSPVIGYTAPPTFDQGSFFWSKLGNTATNPWYMNIVGGFPSGGQQGYANFHAFDLQANDVSWCLFGAGRSLTSTGTGLQTGMANGSAGTVNRALMAGTGSTPSASISSWIPLVQSGYAPTDNAGLGIAALTLATQPGSNYYAVGTGAELHVIQPFAQTDSTATLPGTLTVPSTTIPLSPIAVAYNGSNIWVSSGYFTYKYVNASTSVGTYDSGYGVGVDGFVNTYVTPTVAGTYPAGIYSRAVMATDSSGTLRPCAWIASTGNFGHLVFMALDNAPNGIAGTAPSPMARAYYQRYYSLSVNRHPSNVISANGALTVSAPIVSNSAENMSSLNQLSITQNAAPSQCIRVAQGAVLTGSDTRYYDGTTVRSLGWLSVPQYSGNVGVVSGSGNLYNNTTYTYFLVYVDYDAFGNVIYSSPSAPLIGTTGSTQPCTLQLGPLTAPARASSLSRIEIYRNVRGSASAAGSVYYRAAQFATSLASSSITGLSVVPTTWTDTSSEDISGNQILYSPPTAGELPNDPAPPSNYGVSTKSRLFLANAETTSWLNFSKPYFPGRPPEFNAGQYIDIDPSSGAILGLAALDENVIIFKFDRIILLSGTGPDATGNGAFNPQANVSVDTGLLDPGSILSTESGIYFRSTRGLSLLDRSLNLTWIGQNVDNFIGTSTIVDAVVNSGTSTLRFALNTGSVVTYDYTNKIWSIYNYLNTGTTQFCPSLCMNPAGTAMYYSYKSLSSASNGIAADPVADPTYFTDDGQTYPGIVQSGWIYMQGLGGWGRARRCNIFGTVITGGASIVIQFVYDEGAAVSNNITYTLPSTPGVPFAVRIRLPRQVCRSVSVIVTSSGTTDDCVITGLEVETVIKSAAARTPDSASF